MCKQCDAIKELKDKNSGTVFVYASGSSANSFNLEKYRDQKFIVVNGAAREFLKNKVSFFAYTFTDESFVAQSLDLIRQCLLLARYFFVPFELYQRYLADMAKDANVEDRFYFINRINRMHGEKELNDSLFSLKSAFDSDLRFDFSFFSAKKNKIGFSKDVAKGYFGSRTIPYIALQVIYYLGFEKAFLVGVDLSEASGRFYDKDLSAALPTTLDKDYERFIFPSFQFMAKNIVNSKFQVYNLSQQSRLPHELIPKITYTELEDMLSV